LPVNNSETGSSSERITLDSETGAVAGADRYSEVVVRSTAVAPALGITFGGDEKRFMDLLSSIEEERHREDGGSVSRPKGWRERKNLECSLNFDVGGIGSSRGKNRACMPV
jgi:hypothetical protein